MFFRSGSGSVSAHRLDSGEREHEPDAVGAKVPPGQRDRLEQHSHAPLDATVAEALSTFRTAGHSRLPIYHETLDDPRGMIHIRDFLDFLAAHPAFGLVAADPAPTTSAKKFDMGTPLSETAAATGFADQSHLTRHFSARFGLTPGRWATLSRAG